MTNARAIDLFGGEQALADQLWNALRQNGPLIKRLLENSDPVSSLKQVSRQELLDHLFQSGIAIDEVMRPKWDAETKAYWLKRLNESGTGTGIGANGQECSEELVLELFVRLEALSELCGGAPLASIDSPERMAELREKYRKRLLSTST